MQQSCSNTNLMQHKDVWYQIAEGSKLKSQRIETEIDGARKTTSNQEIKKLTSRMKTHRGILPGKN